MSLKEQAERHEKALRETMIQHAESEVDFGIAYLLRAREIYVRIEAKTPELNQAIELLRGRVKP